MTYILNIDSSTKNCSVSISLNGKTISVVEEVFENYAHSEKLLPFIDEVISKTNISKVDLNAIAISKGPGSYTGLRIGVSLAKGLAYALQIPIITLDTTEVLAHSFLKENIIENNSIICSMIDARRMEVFRCFYDKNANPISAIEAKIVDENFTKEFLEKKIYFIGDTASKIKDVIDHKSFEIFDLYPSSTGLSEAAYKKYLANNFEDLAYFEPYYLKEFMMGS